MNESTLTTQFLKWCKAYKRETFVFEAKYSKKGIIQFSEVKEHQEHALMVTYHDHLVYKLPDGGYSESPFDGISLKKIPAYIVLFFGTDFFMIDIDDWMEMKKNSNRRSLTLEECARLFHKYSLKVSKVVADEKLKIKN